MPDSLVLLEDGLVGLDLGRVVVDGEAVSARVLDELETPAPLIEEVLGQVEVGRFPRQAIELDQGQLDLPVAGMVTARFVSIRGAQNPSVTLTAVKGTGLMG